MPGCTHLPAHTTHTHIRRTVGFCTHTHHTRGCYTLRYTPVVYTHTTHTYTHQRLHTHTHTHAGTPFGFGYALPHILRCENTRYHHAHTHSWRWTTPRWLVHGTHVGGRLGCSLVCCFRFILHSGFTFTFTHHFTFTTARVGYDGTALTHVLGWVTLVGYVYVAFTHTLRALRCVTALLRARSHLRYTVDLLHTVTLPGCCGLFTLHTFVAVLHDTRLHTYLVVGLRLLAFTDTHLRCIHTAHTFTFTHTQRHTACTHTVTVGSTHLHVVQRLRLRYSLRYIYVTFHQAVVRNDGDGRRAGQ